MIRNDEFVVCQNICANKPLTLINHRYTNTDYPLDVSLLSYLKGKTRSCEKAFDDLALPGGRSLFFIGLYQKEKKLEVDH